MIDYDVVPKELLLHDEDFPDNYEHMAHPEDYKEVDEFASVFTYHSRFCRHDRMIVRIGWKTNNGFIPMSFVCDTGAPSHMYLSQEALNTLKNAGLLMTDERETPYVKIHRDCKNTFLATVEETPHVHKRANILGLKSLKKLHLAMKDDTFSFNDGFRHF